MSTELPQRDDYQNIFLNDIPLLDVRAPVEFKQGAFPSAKNIPLINDEERHDIGVRYKKQGQQKAIELGHKLVSGPAKDARVSDWIEFANNNPDGVLYCFRGGMRSEITQQWIYENTGIVYPRVKGGYKSMRRYLLDKLESTTKDINPLVLSGRTGAGKTELLKSIESKIDLENIFHHRGSAFGHHATPQPSQIDIENKLAIKLLKFKRMGINTLVFEDESAAIGSRRLPDCLIYSLKQSSIVLLESSVDERVETIFNEYVTVALNEFQQTLGEEEGFKTWSNNLFASLDKINRRLGGQHYKSIKSSMEYAVDKHLNAGDPGDHSAWIHDLLVGYYDPMYDYQLSRKSDRVVFRGNKDAVLEFIKNSTVSNPSDSVVF